jgi:broad specificity phosphatase PhoE
MRVILTRHYQTQSNAAGRILGWTDAPPCAGWENDVDFIVGRLRELGIGFDAVYSSDLPRSRETARAFASAFGVAEVIGKSDLKEVNYGDLQGRSKKWAHQQYPEHKENPDLVYPAGESFRQMQQRSVRCISELESVHSQETIFIVSHAGAIRGIVSHFLGLEYGPNLKFRVPFRYIGDFQIEGGRCLRYDEHGKPSGLVDEGRIALPLSRDSSAF